MKKLILGLIIAALYNIQVNAQYVQALTTVGDTNYQISSVDRTVVTSAITAARVWTLPAPVGAGAVGYIPGKELIIADLASVLSAPNNITVVPSGTDTIEARGGPVANIVLNAAGQSVTLRSGGPGKWIVVGTNGAGSGTVTSVALTAPAGGVFSVTGSPITTGGTLALAASGTSGGIPFFVSSTNIGSSVVLTANRLLLGGGAGAAPAPLGSLGTTTTILHGNAAGAPTFAAVSLTADVSGNLPVTNLNNGTGASATSFWRGDGGWAGAVTSVAASAPGGGVFSFTGSPVTTTGTLGLAAAGTSGGIPCFSSTSAIASSVLQTANAIMLGGGAGVCPSPLGSLGTTTTVLHGNAAGAPTFGAVSLTADVSGILPNANGGSNISAVTDVAATFVSRALCVLNTGSTNDSASGSGAYVDFTPTCTVPANFLVANRALRITAHFRYTTGTVPPNLNIKLKFGATELCSDSATAPTGSQTNFQYGYMWLVQGTAAPSASSNVEATLVGSTNGIASTAISCNTTMPVALATNGSLAITIASKWSAAGTGTTNIKLSQLVVEALN